MRQGDELTRDPIYPDVMISGPLWWMVSLVEYTPEFYLFKKNNKLCQTFQFGIIFVGAFLIFPIIFREFTSDKIDAKIEESQRQT